MEAFINDPSLLSVSSSVSIDEFSPNNVEIEGNCNHLRSHFYAMCMCYLCYLKKKKKLFYTSYRV